MKNLTASRKPGFVLLISAIILLGCKKEIAFQKTTSELQILTTTPAAKESNSVYDESITATLNMSLDTQRFFASITIVQGDKPIEGKTEISANAIRFTPKQELSPSSSYKASVIIYDQIGDLAPIFTYEWVFDTKPEDIYEMTWRSDNVTDFVRDGNRSMQIGEYLYSFGGWHVPEESFNDVYRSKDDLRKWEKLPNAPWHGRHVYGIAKIQDSTYIVGGDNLQQTFDVWRTTDGENWTLLSQNILGNRIYYGCTTHNGYIYVVGGLGYNDIWRSKNGKDWEQVGDDLDFLDGECFAGSLASYKGKLWIVCGGNNGFGYGSIRKQVWSSVDGKEWKREKDFAGSKRYYTDVIVWDNKLWVIGGFNYEEGNVKSIWYMKPDGSWKEFETPEDYIGRHATGVAVYNNQLVITCGNYQNNCWAIRKVQ